MLISFTALIFKASKTTKFMEKKHCNFINIYVFIHMYIITFTTSHILLTVMSETSTADQFLHRSEKFSTINKSFKCFFFSHMK